MNILTTKEINKALLLKDTFRMKLNSLEYQLIQEQSKKEICSFPLKEKIMMVIITLMKLLKKELMLH